MSPLPQPSSSSSSYKTPTLLSTSPSSYLLLRATHALTLPKAAAQSLRVCSAPSIPSSPSSSSDASDLAYCCYSVASSPPSSPRLARWDGLRRGNHLLLLHATACAVAISASWLFFSMIPSLLAWKRAAESLEKLLDVTRGELPETMAAVRLTGMEISHLTMDLSDLGQELTKGVRSSTSVVRAAEGQLHQLTSTAPQESVQRPVSLKNGIEGPLLARTARDLREEIADSRTFFGVAFSIMHFARWALNFSSKRRMNRSS